MVGISLAGDWSLHDGEGGYIAPCAIPGDVHSALIAAGRIPDPMVGTAEDAVQWVGDATWELRRSFSLDAADLAGRWPVLDLEFVDTFATVFVNGRPVAELGSTFRRHRIDLAGALVPGENHIAFRFRPAAAEAHARAEALPFPVPWSVSNNRIADMNTIRKVQCHAGWDWGPCLMVLGVYAPPVLHLFEGARIETAVIRQAHRDDGAVTVTAEVALAAPSPMTVALRFAFGDAMVSTEVTVGADGGRASLAVEVTAPDLWWPAGHGAQPLTEAVVSIPGDSVIRRIGLRRLELVNRSDADGLSLVFRVNGRDIFAKGANWIPADALPARITPARIRRLLEDAVAANMNMVRVWGGGFYEFDAFYDACDELGLLVWQDMMFSCSQYPSTDEFLAEVDAEVRHQVARLASRPSLALWCGDNEVIGSLTWYPLSRDNRDRYLVNYDRFNRVVERAVRESDPDRAFWPSSPCSGALDYGDAWHDDSKGDMHFWSVWHEGKDFEHYFTVRPRFCSEFGFQSFPTMRTIAGFALAEEWNVTAPVMEHHQRDRSGNSKILETMTRYFRVPTGFAEFVYLSQLQQALAIETAVRFWRSLKPRCMGTLYWQLNDVWPAVSWSSIDHSLAWKALHHHARRFYAPLALATRIEDGMLIVSAASDLAAAVPLRFRVRRIALDGETLASHEGKAVVPAERAVELGRFPAPPDAGSFLVVDAAPHERGAWDPMLQLVAFTEKPKRMALPAARVFIEADPATPGGFAFSSDLPAFFVAPEAPGCAGRFSDSSILLLPGEPRTLTFTPRPGSAMPRPEEIAAAHLAETYR